MTPEAVPAPWRAWAALVAVAACRAYRALVLVLALTALLPVLGGWSSYLVRSGSMEPSISAGDVVLAQPVTADDAVPVGRVMVFEAERVGRRELVVHRIVGRRADGRYTTAGDANADTDSAPVGAAQLRGRGVLLVPWVGLPLHWLVTGRSGLALATLALTVAAFAVPVRHGAARSVRGRHRGRRSFRRGPALAAVTVVAGATLAASGAPGSVAPGDGAVLASASAGFTARTTSRPNTWAVRTRPLQRYSAAVLADRPYVYYRLDEASGTTAADDSGNRLPATYTSGPSYRRPGALPNNVGYGIGLAGGTQGVLAGGTATTNPTVFTVELWFRTSTASGGKLFGFESTRSSTSPSYDRHLFLRPDGRLVYGGWGTNPSLLVSPSAYSDGVWHQLVLTSALRQGRHDTVMYVDGKQVAAGPTTATSSYSGWWRVGYGSLPTGAGYPASAGYVGEIDNISGYWAELTAARVAAHYAAR